MFKDFDALKWFKRIFWVIVAGSLGIATQINQVAGDDGFQMTDIDWTSAGILMFVWGASRATVGWMNANRPPWAVGKKLLTLALICGLGASLAACGTFRPALGDHSATQVLFDEHTAAGDKTRIEIKATGEAAQTAGVKYQGQTTSPDETPWSLTVSGDQSVTSPQAQVIAQGIGSAIEQTPSTISGLAAQIAGLMAVPGLTGGPQESGGGLGGLIVRPIIERMIEGFLSRASPLTP